MLHVRMALPDDAETIAELQCRMARETEGLALDPARVRAGVRAVFADPRKGAYRVAEADGEIVACLLTVPEWSDWRNATILWIHSLYVVPAFRRRGVFRALFESLRRQVLAEPALAGLRLYVESDNTRAQHAYRAVGMDGERYRMFQWMKDDARREHARANVEGEP